MPKYYAKFGHTDKCYKDIIASRFKLLHRKHRCLDVTVQVKEKRFTARAAKFKKEKPLFLHHDPWVVYPKRRKNK